MSIGITSEFNDARLAGCLEFLDRGDDRAKIAIFNGPRPGTPSEPIPAEAALLTEILLTKPSGTIAGGIMTLSQYSYSLVMVDGAPEWARVYNGEGETAFDCHAGFGSGSWEIVLSQAVLYAGGYAWLESATFM